MSIDDLPNIPLGRCTDQRRKRFGMLLVLDDPPIRKGKSVFWHCLCDCGNKCYITASLLGKRTDCGDHREYNLKDRSGEEYGDLTITKTTPIRKNGITYYECLCKCGELEWIRTDCIEDRTGCKKHKNIRHQNKTGCKYGKLTLLEQIIKKNLNNINVISYRCICECGNEVERTFGDLTRYNNRRHCGCGYERSEKDKHQLYFKQYIDNAKRRKFSFSLTFDEFYDIIHRPCHYCGSIDEEKSCGSYKFNVNGVDRIDSLLGYEKSNVVPCCSTCNRMKLNLTIEAFYDKIKQILTYSGELNGSK